MGGLLNYIENKLIDVSFLGKRPQVERLFQDSRLDTGYEAVPTRDIHLKQINLEDTWLEMLKLYVKPLVESMFMGYNSDVREHRTRSIVVR